jgi:hypothetical protein
VESLPLRHGASKCFGNLCNVWSTFVRTAPDENFKRDLVRVGVCSAVTPHGLRHHAASYHAKVGANLPKLKE